MKFNYLKGETEKTLQFRYKFRTRCSETYVRSLKKTPYAKGIKTYDKGCPIFRMVCMLCNINIAPIKVPIIPIIRETSPITLRHRATDRAPDIVTCFAPPKEYVQHLPKLRHEVAEIPKNIDTGKTSRKEGRSKNLNPFVKSNLKLSKSKLTAATTTARKNSTLIHII